MFLTYEVIATFGISVILSFSLSVAVLIVIAAKRGLLRVGAGSKNSKIPAGSLLLPPSAPPAPDTPKNVEMTPLSPQFV